MGYRTVQACPFIRNYSEALHFHSVIKPLRGRPDMRPLGNRRDADAYNIRMECENVQIVHYRRPVITFRPDNTIKLNMYYDSANCNQLFEQVLALRAYQEDFNNVIQLPNGNKYIYKHEVNLKVEENVLSKDRLSVIDPKAVIDLVLKKDVARDLRKRYAPFLTYVRNMIKLRKHTLTHSSHQYYARQVDQEIVTFYYDELKDYFDLSPSSAGNAYFHLDRSHCKYLLGGADRELHTFRFMELLESGDTSKYHEAMLQLAITSLNHAIRRELTSFNVTVARLKSIVTEPIYYHYRKECLEWVKLPIGKLPHNRYDGWLPQE